MARVSTPGIDDPRLTKALSHPLRVRILAMLDERTASPNELAGRLGASLGTVAYHVRTLDELGMLDLVEETRVRGAVEHHYRARERPSITAEQWTAAPPMARQAALKSSLDVLAAYAQQAAAAGGFDRPDAQLRRALVRLDERGISALSSEMNRLMDRAEKIEAASADRVAKALARRNGTGTGLEPETFEVGLGLLLFEAQRLAS